MAIPTKKELEERAISFCTVDQKARKLFGTEELFSSLIDKDKEVVRNLQKFYNYQVQLEFC